MNFTAGLILIFLNIFIPGLLFLRFYFTGEFSKQFSTRIPIIRLAFYSLIPGIIIQTLGLFFYDCFYPQFHLLESLTIFSDLMGSSENYSEKTIFFINNEIYKYVSYSLLTCLFSSLFGALIHYLVRKLKLDIKYKLLRFRNHWYYVFSGDILKFDKYLKASSDIEKENPYENRNIIMPYADILVSNNGNTKMYTGYVVDYELDSKDINNLDKIYLLDVLKYKYTNDDKTCFEKTIIPGDLFIVNNSQVINMNLTYIPSLKRKDHILSKKQRSKKRDLLYYNIFIVGFSIILLFQVFFNSFELKYINPFFERLNLIQKIAFYFSITTILSLISFIFDKEGRENKKEEYVSTIYGVVLFNLLNGISLLIEYYF